MPGGVNRGKTQLGNAIRSHRDRIEDAANTGNMDKVREANRAGFQEEMREVREYSRRK